MPIVETPGLIIIGLAIFAGLVGVVVPVLPGLVLSWGAVLVWALAERTPASWTVLTVASLLLVASQVLKYVVPGRRMRQAGVPWHTLAAGGVLGIIGFVIVPVAGLVIGFVLGVYLAERARLGTHREAWQSTVQAIKAVGISILIELAAGLLIAAAWLGAVIAT
jgi:uncharacterized protein YqgC (DUF456 family)